MENYPSIMTTFIVGFLAVDILFLALAEGVYLELVKKSSYDWKLFLTALGHRAGNFLFELIPFILVAGSLGAWVYEHRLFTVRLSGPLAYVGLFLVLEFMFYWYHRALHRVRIFWASHCVHHSPNKLDYTTNATLPFFSGSFLLCGHFLVVPGILFGFPPEIFFLAYRLNLRCQFWLHAEWIPKLGWLEYVLNTPSHHRVHHAKNPEYKSGNYGGLLIIFDRMFGTLVVEKESVPCKYGAEGITNIYNPLSTNFQEWRSMGRDLIGAKSLPEFLSKLFFVPERLPGNAVESESGS